MSHHFFCCCLFPDAYIAPVFFFLKPNVSVWMHFFVTEWPGAMFDYTYANWWVSTASRSTTQKSLGGPAQKCSRTWRFHLVWVCVCVCVQGCLFLLHWRLSLVRAFQEAVGSGLVKPAGLNRHIQVTSYHETSSGFFVDDFILHSIPRGVTRRVTRCWGLRRTFATTYPFYGTFWQRGAGNHACHQRN